MNTATRFTNVFSEKIPFQGKQTILGLKTVFPYIFGSALRIFLKFCTMKDAKRYMEVILMVFSKSLIWRQLGHFGPKNGMSLSHLAFTCSKLSIETQVQGVKYVQS